MSASLRAWISSVELVPLAFGTVLGVRVRSSPGWHAISLKDEDIAAPVILESAVQALDSGDAYSRLSNSPADRANSMNPEITQVGVGVRLERRSTTGPPS